MYKLTIKKQDGSTYWIEHFDSQEKGDEWLAEEKTRKYWIDSHTHEFDFIGRTDEEIAERKAEQDASSAAKVAQRDKLKGNKNKNLNLRQLEDLVLEIKEYLEL